MKVGKWVFQNLTGAPPLFPPKNSSDLHKTRGWPWLRLGGSGPPPTSYAPGINQLKLRLYTQLKTCNKCYCPYASVFYFDLKMINAHAPQNFVEIRSTCYKQYKNTTQTQYNSSQRVVCSTEPITHAALPRCTVTLRRCIKKWTLLVRHLNTSTKFDKKGHGIRSITASMSFKQLW